MSPQKQKQSNDNLTSHPAMKVSAVTKPAALWWPLVIDNGDDPDLSGD
jgi:hypothetical protein